MKTYSVVDTDTGKLISVSTEPPEESVVHSRIVSKLAFMRRLSPVELATIYELAKTNTQISVWLEMFKLAEEINLDDPDMVAGIKSFESAGILALGRADEVLK